MRQQVNQPDTTRKLSPEARANGQSIPAHLTGKAAQQVHADQLVRKSQASNQAPRKPSKPTTKPSPAKKAQTQQGIPGVVSDKTGAGGAGGAGGSGNTPSGMSPLQSAMEQNQAPQDTQVTMYAPGAPLPTVEGVEAPEGPRQYNYPVSYNIGSQPRSTELTSAQTLRNLAIFSSAIQLCELVWFDVINRMEGHVTFEENTIPDGESEDDPKWRAIAKPAQDWLQHPDGILTLQEWLTASVRDVLELGYSVVYKQLDRTGRVLSLDLVDAAIVKPLLDERGRLPRPPWAAFQQYIYGLPGGTYRADEMVLMREATRTDSPYSFSRVERVILRINQELRKSNRDLRLYTDGVLPTGLLIPDLDTGWSPEQCEEYEQRFNDMLAGNDRQRARIKVAPPGSTFTSTQPNDPQMDFDRFLLNVAAAAFGCTMDELGFTETSNRSVGDSQENVIYRRLMAPLATRYAALFTEVIKARFDERLCVHWKGFEEKEDLMLKAQTLQIGVNLGALSPSRMAREMGWPVDVEVPPMLITKSGPIWLEDALELREAQQEARLAGLEFAISTPAQTATPPAPGGDGVNAENKPQQSSQQSSQQQQQQDGEQDGDDNKPPTPAKAQEKPPANKPKPKAPAKAQQRVQEPVSIGEHPATTQPSPEQREEYRRWYTVALRAAKQGKPCPRFTTSLIPLEEYALLARDLARAVSPEAVKAAFGAARAREAPRLLPMSALTQPTQPAHQRHPLPRLQQAREAALEQLRLQALHVFDQVARSGHHALH